VIVGTIRGLAFLAGLSFRRQIRSWKTVLCVLFLALLAGLVLLVGHSVGWKPMTFGRWVVVRLFGGFFIPIVALAFGTAALGDDRDERSLVHLLVRALPRAGVYLAKLLAVAPIAIAFSLGSLALLSGIARFSMGEDAPEVFGPFWPGILLATIAYLSLFHLFGALFKHATVIAIAYVFFVEAFLGQVPGILNRLSINFHATAIAFGSEATRRLMESGRDVERYLTLDPGTAAWVLASSAVVLLAAGALVFCRREYRDLT
jgi:ABC-2 type transport system permease protein